MSITKIGVEPDYETYLHRIGRSARFGQIGVAINLVYDQKYVFLITFEVFILLIFSSFNLLQGLKHYFFPTDPTKIAELKNDKNDPRYLLLFFVFLIRLCLFSLLDDISADFISVTIDDSLQKINEKLEMFAT